MCCCSNVSCTVCVPTRCSLCLLSVRAGRLLLVLYNQCHMQASLSAYAALTAKPLCAQVMAQYYQRLQLVVPGSGVCLLIQRRTLWLWAAKMAALLCISCCSPLCMGSTTTDMLSGRIVYKLLLLCTAHQLHCTLTS